MGLVTLDSNLGIERCTALRDTLSAALAEPSLQVDGDAVERVHSASLQLLAAWWRHRRTAGLDTAWSDCAAPLRDAAGRLGLDATLGLDLAPAPAQQQHTVEKT